MTYLLTLDPGGCTGINYAQFDERTAYTRIGYWAVPGGTEGLRDWLVYFLQSNTVDVVVAEQFVPDNTPGGRNIVAPECQGVLKTLFADKPIHWQARSEKTWGGSIKQADAKLKALGLWVTGKQVGWEDGRDVNDSTLHSIQYLRKIRHRPTLIMLSS